MPGVIPVVMCLSSMDAACCPSANGVVGADWPRVFVATDVF